MAAAWSVVVQRAFGKAFRAARGERTVREVQQESGVSERTIYNLEHGPFPGMRFVDVCQLAHFYGYSADYIYGVLEGVNGSVGGSDDGDGEGVPGTAIAV